MKAILLDVWQNRKAWFPVVGMVCYGIYQLSQDDGAGTASTFTGVITIVGLKAFPPAAPKS